MVNRAGRIMRRYVLAQTSDEAEFDHALSIVVRDRAAHQYPLAKATMGVRSGTRRARNGTSRCRYLEALRAADRGDLDALVAFARSDK
jgi:hypothetical protein